MARDDAHHNALKIFQDRQRQLAVTVLASDRVSTTYPTMTEHMGEFPEWPKHNLYRCSAFLLKRTHYAFKQSDSLCPIVLTQVNSTARNRRAES